MSALAHDRRVSHRRLRALQAIYFALTCVVVLTRVLGYAWLLDELGTGWLPWIYLLQAIPLSLLTFGLIAVVDRVGRAALLSALCALSAVGVIVAHLGVLAGLHGLSSFFLLGGEAAISALGVHFWLLASELVSPEQARRHFPSLALVGAVGAIVAGGVVQLMPRMAPESMLLLLVIPLAMCGGLAWLVHRCYPYRVGPRRSSLDALSWRQDLQEGLALIFQSGLLRWMALLTAAITSAGVVIDYLYNVAAAQSTSGGHLPAFFGSIQVMVNVAQLILVLAAGSRIFTSFGLVRTLSSYPFGGVLLAAVALLSGAPLPVLGLKVFDRLENYLILNPGVGIALGAFPKERRGRASFVYGGLVKPAAIVATGLGLYVIRDSRVLLGLLAGFFLLFFVVLRRLGDVYRSTLADNLRSSDPRLIANGIEALAEPENRMLVPRLLEFLEKTDEPVFKENVLLAAGRIRDARFVPALLEALSGRHLSLKCAAARSLGHFPTPQVRDALLRALREEDSARVKARILSSLSGELEPAVLYPVLRAGLRETDARVQANAVEAIGLTRDPALVAELRPLLEHDSPRVVANAIVALARVPAELAGALDRLHRLFQCEDRMVWLSALYAAGEVASDRFDGLLRMAIDSPDIDLRRHAAIALGKHDEPDAVTPLFALLVGQPEQARAVALMLERLGDTVRELLLERLCAALPGERELAVQALRSCGYNYPDELEQLEALSAPPIAPVLTLPLKAAPLRP